MIGVDTNVLVRPLVGDDPPQAEAATRFLQAHCSAEDPALVCEIVLVETAWVLEDVYEYTRAQICAAFEGVLVTAQLRVGASSSVLAALQKYRLGAADFADCLLGVGNVRAGCSYTATFDRKAARLEDFRLIPA